MEPSQRKQHSWRHVGTLAALAVLLAVGATAKTKNASDYFTICHRAEPDFTGCALRSLTQAKPRLVQGIPELRMLPVDPLYLEQVELRDGQGNFVFVMRLKNASITGLGNFTVRSLQSNPELNWWRIDAFIPHMHVGGQYEMGGRLLALPIQGDGDITMDFYNVSAVQELRLKNVTRKGKVHYNVDTLKWTIGTDFATSHFTNLFNGDERLGEPTNKFLNENWRDSFETYKHLPEEAFGKFFFELENNFFQHFPLEELFPE